MNNTPASVFTNGNPPSLFMGTLETIRSALSDLDAEVTSVTMGDNGLMNASVRINGRSSLLTIVVGPSSITPSQLLEFFK